MPTNNKHKKGYYLALIATILASIVVGVGAYTRLVHAGLGCPDWPGCYGFLTVPGTEQAISIAESRFPDSPVDKAKGWAEMGHRYVAGLLMILVLVLAIQSYWYRRERKGSWRLPCLILALIILQAAFGMWTVTLKLWPQVVTAHLLGGFTTLSLLFLLTLRLSGASWKRLPATWRLDKLKRLAVFGLIVVIIQITLGGWTSSNYAALACPDLPTCQDQFWPDMDFQKGFDIGQSIGPNYLGGQLNSEARTAIHISHRLGALVVMTTLLFLFFSARCYAVGLASEEKQSVEQLSSLILLALIIQLVLGASNVIWHLPLSVAVAHNLGGALLLLSLVAFNYRLSTLVDKDR